MNSKEIPIHVLAQWADLVSRLKPKGYCITRYDEPIDDAVFTDEESVRDAIENDADSESLNFSPVFLCLTIGWSPEKQSWGYQTGDNSFTGGAYGHPVWGVAWISQESDPEEVAKELADEILDSIVKP